MNKFQTAFNNQIKPETIKNILANLDLNQNVDSMVLADALNGLIYNDEMFNGAELDIDAVAVALFNEFEQNDVGGQLNPDEVPLWPKIIAVHYSGGDIAESDLENVSIDCSLDAFKKNLDFNKMDSLFNLWASTLPLCAMGYPGS